MNLHSSLVLGLICGLFATVSPQAHASDEAYSHIIKLPNNSWEIYARPSYKDGMMNSMGTGARLKAGRVSGSDLYLLNEYDALHVIPYLTPERAKTALKELEAGASIDLTKCISRGEAASDPLVEATVDANGCVNIQHKLVVNCSTWTPTPNETSAHDKTLVGRLSHVPVNLDQQFEEVPTHCPMQ